MLDVFGVEPGRRSRRPERRFGAAGQRVGHRQHVLVLGDVRGAFHRLFHLGQPLSLPPLVDQVQSQVDPGQGVMRLQLKRLPEMFFLDGPVFLSPGVRHVGEMGCVPFDGPSPETFLGFPGGIEVQRRGTESGHQDHGPRPEPFPVEVGEGRGGPGQVKEHAGRIGPVVGSVVGGARGAGGENRRGHRHQRPVGENAESDERPGLAHPPGEDEGGEDERKPQPRTRLR